MGWKAIVPNLNDGHDGLERLSSFKRNSLWLASSIGSALTLTSALSSDFICGRLSDDCLCSGGGLGIVERSSAED